MLNVTVASLVHFVLIGYTFLALIVAALAIAAWHIWSRTEAVARASAAAELHSLYAGGRAQEIIEKLDEYFRALQTWREVEVLAQDRSTAKLLDAVNGPWPGAEALAQLQAFHEREAELARERHAKLLETLAALEMATGVRRIENELFAVPVRTARKRTAGKPKLEPL